MCYNIQMKYFFVLILLLFVGCSAEKSTVEIPEITTESAPTPTTRIVTVAGGYPYDSAAGVFIESFASELEEISEGELEVLVYHEGFLGDDVRLSQLMSEGELDFALLNFEASDPLTTIFNTPFLFNDENIDSAIDILNDADPSQSRFSVLRYVNCGSIGIQTDRIYETVEGIFIETENSNSEPIYTNLQSDTLSYDYFADIDYRYDVKHFCMSSYSGLRFDELHMVNLAVDVAIESMDIAYNTTAAPDNITIYQPSNYQNYIDTLLPASTRLPEDEDLLQTLQLFNDLLNF